MSKRRSGERIAIGKALDRIVIANRACLEREFVQAGAKQAGPRVVGLREDLLPAKRVGDDDLQFAGSGDRREILDGEWPGWDVPRLQPVAVDEHVHRRRHDGLAPRCKKRRGDERGLRSEIRAELQPAETHGTSPGPRGADSVADPEVASRAGMS